jgi:carbon monoxide dehydrogenase subunit G
VPELVERIDVDAPPERVWAALTAWDRQGEWMLATDVSTVDGPAQEVGGRLVARTGLPRPGGRRLGVVDTMVVTEWDPPRQAVVEHTGRIVRGYGVFEVLPRDGGATVVWREELDLPLGRLGRLGWPLAKPVVVLGLRLSLRRFPAFVASFGE